MKNILTFFSTALMLTLSINTSAQNYDEFIVIDEIAENVTELIALNQGKDNVLQISGTGGNAISQISTALQKGQVGTLIIYAATKPGAIIFNSVAITSDNVDEFSKELQVWRMYVLEKVTIQSHVVFESENGRLLREKLETITGLTFESQSL